MPADSRSKNGVASLAYVAGIPIGLALPRHRNRDGRNKSGHDGRKPAALANCPQGFSPLAPQGQFCSVLDARPLLQSGTAWESRLDRGIMVKRL
jgi:hypothetical protein